MTALLPLGSFFRGGLFLRGKRREEVANKLKFC